MFKKLSWLRFTDRVIYHKALYVHKCLYGSVPEYLTKSPMLQIKMECNLDQILPNYLIYQRQEQTHLEDLFHILAQLYGINYQNH